MYVSYNLFHSALWIVPVLTTQEAHRILIFRVSWSKRIVDRTSFLARQLTSSSVIYPSCWDCTWGCSGKKNDLWSLAFNRSFNSSFQATRNVSGPSATGGFDDWRGFSETCKLLRTLSNHYFSYAEFRDLENSVKCSTQKNDDDSVQKQHFTVYAPYCNNRPLSCSRLASLTRQPVYHQFFDVSFLLNIYNLCWTSILAVILGARKHVHSKCKCEVSAICTDHFAMEPKRRLIREGFICGCSIIVSLQSLLGIKGDE